MIALRNPFPFDFSTAVLVGVEVGFNSVRMIARAASGGCIARNVATWCIPFHRVVDASRTGGNVQVVRNGMAVMALAFHRGCRPQPSHVAGFGQRRNVALVLDRHNPDVFGSFRRNLATLRRHCCPLLIDVNSKNRKEFNVLQVLQVAFFGGRA